MATTRTPRRRDAAKTRQLLLDAAVHRFTHHGYAATTVRHIADDAGVNVALISRYFRSKEGLFEACLSHRTGELEHSAGTETHTGTDTEPPSWTAEAIARQMVGPCTRGEPLNLVLLLRSSGDETADRIRLDLLRAYGERLAAAAGRTDDEGLLRAQMMIAAAAGIALMHARTGMRPLSTATEDDLFAPLCAMIDSLLFADRG